MKKSLVIASVFGLFAVASFAEAPAAAAASAAAPASVAAPAKHKAKAEHKAKVAEVKAAASAASK
jgi:hypothetical protein